MDFARSSRKAKSRKSHVSSTWLEVEESCQVVIFASVSWVRPSRETVTKHSAWRFFLRVTSLPFTHTIYTLITHKCKTGYSERKTLDRFSTTHTPIFLRESYLSLVRIHCSLFSFPLPLSYLERRFVPKHNPHIFRVHWMFLVLLGSIRRSQGWQIQYGAYCGIQRTRQDTIPRSFVRVGAWRA